MEVVERRRASKEETCERCRRSLPRSAFGRSDKLAGGRYPWCSECAADANADAAEVLTRRRAYQRSYMRRRREGLKLRWLVITVPGRGRVLARWSASRREVRITGPFALLEDTRRILTGAFRVSVKDVAECGRGAGRGVRRQRTFSSRGPVGQKAWERGSDALIAEGVAQERF